MASCAPSGTTCLDITVDNKVDNKVHCAPGSQPGISGDTSHRLGGAHRGLAMRVALPYTRTWQLTGLTRDGSAPL